MSIAGEVSAAEGWVSLSGDLGEMVAATAGASARLIKTRG